MSKRINGNEVKRWVVDSAVPTASWTARHVPRVQHATALISESGGCPSIDCSLP